jgi:hypothetical protein
MRDHLLGYPSNAARAAEVAQEGPYFELGDEPYSEAYPLGVPTRVRKEWSGLFDTPHRDPKLGAFETKVHALPDGSRINKHGHDMRAKGAHLAPGEAVTAALKEAMEKHRDCIVANLQANNQLVRQGSSLKPAPVVEGAPVGIVDAYFSGYAHARQEEAATMNAQAAQARAQWDRDRGEHIQRNERARYAQGMSLLNANAPHLGTGLGYGQEGNPCGLLGG